MSRIDDIKWKLHLKKRDVLIRYGVSRGLVRMYDDELLSRLRHIYYGGIPATILLLHAGLCNGFCYDRGTLVSLGFGEDDFNIVDEDVDSIKLNPKYVEEHRIGKLGDDYPNHCVAERTDSRGIVWVYDTSVGLVFEKTLYGLIERPRVTKVNDRQSTIEFLEEDFLRDMDIERDRYVLHVTLPLIEAKIIPVQNFYKDQLLKEIEILKEEVDYDGVVCEIHEDMKRMGLK